MSFTNYFEPFLQSLLFVLGIYAEKFIRKLIYPKNKNKHTYQFKVTCRIITMIFVTFILMFFNYSQKCHKIGCSFLECFYIKFEFLPLFQVLVANSILFGYHIYEKYRHNELNLSRFNVKGIIFAPLLQQLLFRACFYRSSEQNVSLMYLSLLFSIAHFHRLIWKKINKKQYQVKKSINQMIFTFVFGCYSFYFLSTFKNILSSILLHCYCNYLGPPSIRKDNKFYHLGAVICFFAYLYIFV